MSCLRTRCAGRVFFLLLVRIDIGRYDEKEDKIDMYNYWKGAVGVVWHV